MGSPPPPQPPVTLQYAIAKALRRWVKDRTASIWRNIKADCAFCGDAFKATFAQGWWSKMIAVLTHTNKWLNRFLSVGVLAGIMGLYIRFVYPHAGNAGTAIIVLSVLVFCSLVTIRVTRRFYEKTSASLLETQGQVDSLTAESKDHARLIQAARTAMATARREIAALEEQLKPKVEITNIFWDQYERDGDSVQLLRLEVTSNVATWAQVTVDQVELDGYLLRKLHLHIQHKPWDVNKTELLPRRPEYWDLVQKARRSDDIELMHVEPLVKQRVLNRGNEFRLRLTVACDKGPGVSETITIERNGDELDFK